MLIWGCQILNALKRAHGKRKEAARILGISVRTLSRKMKTPEFLQAKAEAEKFELKKYLAELDATDESLESSLDLKSLESSLKSLESSTNPKPQKVGNGNKASGNRKGKSLLAKVKKEKQNED